MNNKIITYIIILALLMVVGGSMYLQSKKLITEPGSVQNNLETPLPGTETQPTPTQNASEPQSIQNYFGTYTLSGYVEIGQVQDFSGKNFEYAFFRITESDNLAIYDFLKEYEGNSFVKSEALGLGCYDKASQYIQSTNIGDDGKVSNMISGSDLKKLLDSTQTHPISLKLTKPVYTGGTEAPVCYSHFRSFEIQ